MRVLCVHPGATTSVSDVHRGLMSGLSHQAGVELDEYSLGGRIAMQGEFLKMMYKRARRLNPDCPVPSPTDMIKRACRDLPDAIWKHQADWVLFTSAMFVHPDSLAALRWYGRPRVGIVLTESPYDDDRQRVVAPFCDVCWTNERTSVDGLRQVQPETYYLPHAYNPAVHFVSEPDPAVPAHDVVFVGTLFQERIELLSAVDWKGLGINLGIYGNVDYLPSRHRLRPYVRGHQIENDYAVALYRRARIGLNLYRKSMGWGKDAQRIDTAESMNPRAYELAACGCFTISDYRPEVQELCGDLVPTFRQSEDFGPLLVRWLADDAGRQAVARQLPVAMTLETWDARAETVLQRLRQMDRRAA